MAQLKHDKSMTQVRPENAKINDLCQRNSLREKYSFSLFKNGDSLPQKSDQVQDKPSEGLTRPTSLPGILKVQRCHCSACCSCSPQQQNCFIPSFSLSQPRFASCDKGLDYIISSGGQNSDVETRKLQSKNTDSAELAFGDCSTRIKTFSESINASISEHDIMTELDQRPNRVPRFVVGERPISGSQLVAAAAAGHHLVTEGKPFTSHERTVPSSELHSRVWNNKVLKMMTMDQQNSQDQDEKTKSHFVNYETAALEFTGKLQVIKQWFREFDDTEKNIVLKSLVENSSSAQKHLLSMEMEYYSHNECPPNCRDRIQWLPDVLSIKIFSYLDPVSLCRASCVCQKWNQIASDHILWRQLSTSSKWRLSKAGEQKQLLAFTLPDDEIDWKGLFAERFRLQSNWIKGRCNIRTFEGHTQGVSCVQFDETRIVSGSSDKTIKLWNIRTNSQWAVQTLVGHSGTVRCLHLDGNRLVSGSSDKTIKVWDLSSQQNWASIACKVTMTGHADTVRCLKVDADKVISGSYDKTLKVWDIKTGNCRRTLSGHEAAVLCVQFDGTKIISGSCDKTIKVWTFEGYCVMTLQGHQDAVTCLQFDETRIISGSLDCTLRFWNVHNGHPIKTIDWKASEGHTRVVRFLQADSWRVVSASDDKTIKVWSLETGQRLVTLRNHTDGVTCLQFNDSVLVSGSYDKTVKLWDFSCC